MGKRPISALVLATCLAPLIGAGNPRSGDGKIIAEGDQIRPQADRDRSGSVGKLFPLGSAAPRRTVVTVSPAVATLSTMMPMDRGMEIAALELAASAVPHRLAMAHAATPADRTARWMCRSAIGGFAMMVRTCRVMMRTARVVAAHIDPAVGRTRLRHWRERRRRR